MDLTLKNLCRIGKVFLFQSQGEAEAFRQVRVRLFFVELIREVIEHRLVLSIFHHAEREGFKDRLVVQIMLDRPALKPFDG